MTASRRRPDRPAPDAPDADAFDWMDDAACVGLPPEYFDGAYGHAHGANNVATATCHTCPVKVPCALFADRTESFGLFGGLRFGDRTDHRHGFQAKRPPRELKYSFPRHVEPIAVHNRVLVDVRAWGRPGPHPGVVTQIHKSGRITAHLIGSAGGLIVTTDPQNVLIDHTHLT